MPPHCGGIIALNRSGFPLDLAGDYPTMFNLEESEIINKSIQIISDKWKKEAINIANARVAKDFCILHAAGLEHESFGVLFLNTKHTLIHFEYMFRGTLTEGAVYPREIAV